jgi:heme/copper-type cytochrome/quinol oxidase subunit 2
MADRLPSLNGHLQQSSAESAVPSASASASLPYRRLIVLGAAITVLIALIVLGSRPYPGSQGEGQTNTAVANAITDAITVLMMIATVAGAALLAFIFWPMRRRRRKDDEEYEEYVEPQRVHWTVKLALILLPLLMVAGLIYAVYHVHGGSMPAPTEVPLGGPVAPLAPTQQAQPGPAVTPQDNNWVAIAAAAALIFAALAVVIWALRRRTGAPAAVTAPAPETGPTLTEDLAAALDESLDDLRQERDPRRAVIGAYARMERILARHGLPRRRVETPYEYASRVLREAGLGEGAVRGLTNLFELARFSHHEIGTSMKEEAVAALVAIREEL